MICGRQPVIDCGSYRRHFPDVFYVAFYQDGVIPDETEIKAEEAASGPHGGYIDFDVAGKHGQV